LINIGAYIQGSNPEIDYAIKMIDNVNTFLRQNIGERVDFASAGTQLQDLLKL